MRYEIETVKTFKLICIDGEVENEEDVKLLNDEISTLTERGSRRFVFELKDTRYLNSAAVSVILQCLCSVERKDGSVFVIAQDERMRAVLEMVGLNRVIKVFNSKNEFWKEQGVMC
ncbi:MAG: STAS domain-containing protein [Chitinispirillales bacterium]|jgi:anti-anti-sigma factor|nr:STAS domain-containing protein [Chitinispirillales bacterium]